MRGLFVPIRPLDDQRVLVIDDVITTGATITEAANVIASAGAATVFAAAIARSLGT